jgi:hypothetical protein
MESSAASGARWSPWERDAPVGFTAIGNEGGNLDPEGRQQKGAGDVGSSGGLETEVDSEASQHRRWAQCIAEMLVKLERLQRLVQIRTRTSGGEQRASRLTACEATGVAPAAAIASLEAAAAGSST